MERRGRPVFGAIAGACFFFFLGLSLMVFGVIPLNGPWLAFPLLGLAVGALWGAWAPLGRRKASSSSLALVPGRSTSTLGTKAPPPAWTVRRVTEEVPAVSEPASSPAEDGATPSGYTPPTPPPPVPPAPPAEEPPLHQPPT